MSFQTFWHFIEELASKPLPPQVDRSLMGSKSGTDQNNLTAALTAFDLIGAGGVVKPALRQLVEADADARKPILAALVRHYYPAPITVSEDHGTEQQLHEAFQESFNMSGGETRRKSVTFFLHAARTAGVPLSANFPQTRSGSGAPGASRPKKTGARKKTNSGSGGVAGKKDEAGSEEQYQLSVNLQTGGTMSLTVSVNPLTLRGQDRTFFYEVVDKLTDYQAEHSDDSQPDAEAGS
jgi:hypothetical protein